MLPILHFTYADPHSDLPNIQVERKAHFNLFIPRLTKSGYHFVQNFDFQQNDLQFGLENYLSDLSIFHFSGHAGMSEIVLEDGSAFIKGLAAQMARALSEAPLPRLVLVFLNGCSTGFMTDALLGAGVPVVIGTSAPVNDRKAADFSIAFYTELLKGKTLLESFDRAVELLNTIDANIEIHRGIQAADTDEDAPLWGIFFKEDKKNMLDWRIPQPPNYKGSDGQETYEINSHIRPAIYHALLIAGDNNIRMLEELRAKGEDIDESINSNLLLGFPGPISCHMARLLEPDPNGKLSKNELYPRHLENIYNLYQSLSELMFLVMISQLWDICLGEDDEPSGPDPGPRLPVENSAIHDQLELIRGFFSTTRRDRRYFDYIPRIRAIRQIFDIAEKKYFIEELETLKRDLENDQDFIACYHSFNKLREDLKNNNYLNFAIAEWETKCEEAEKNLGYFIQKISFCARYDFAILKNIELNFPRYKQRPSYTYRLLKFPKNGNKTYKSYSPVMDGFTSVKSVVMLKTETIQKGGQNLSGQINLYPFMVDNNVDDPRGTEGDVIIYSHFDKITGNYKFEEALRLESMRDIRTDNSLFNDIHASINAFSNALFGSDIQSLNS
jgi:hypothetical protein